MWNYFIFFSLIFLLKTESYVTQHNKTDHILYRRNNGAKLLSENIKKPETDPSSYRLIELSNGLRTLLISDPLTLKAGASLDMGVGHYSDPEDIPGVAHFCEHLLFMGTKKYPGEDDFSGYLTTHSGSYNAYTSTENTNYFFSVSYQFYETALDMFSQFFISPLISEKSVEREAHAVDLEHRKNLQSDAWRIFQLEKSTSNPKSPYSKFGTGDYVTLVENTRKRGLNIASIVSKFFSTYYSSNLMRLVLFSSGSLDELEGLAIKYFTDVPNKNIERPKFTEKPFGSDVIGKQFWYKPIADVKTIELIFPIDTQREFYKSNPVSYLAYFLQHESYGSVFYTLKQKGWATSLKVYTEYIVSGTDAFRINVGLTDDGLENYEDIILLIFKFLNLLQEKGPQKEHFEDLIKIDDIHFRFQDRPSLISYASRLASDMQGLYIENEDILRSSYVSVYNPEHITNLLTKLHRNNFFFTIVSKTKPGVWDLREPWYGSEYKVEPFSQTLLEKIEKLIFSVNLQLPEKNIFIPETFIRTNVSEHKTNKPVLMYNDTRIRYWYKEDDTFSSPKTSIFVFIRIPDYVSSPFESAHSSVYVDMLYDHVYTLYYNAAVAGYRIGLFSADFGIYLSLYGFSDKILLLLKEVVNSIKEFNPTNSSFVASRQRLIDTYTMNRYSMPYKYVSSIYPEFYSPFNWPSSDILHALKLMVFDDVRFFHMRRFSAIFSEILAVGVLSNQTQELFEVYFKDLSDKKQYAYQILPPRSYVLKEGSNYIYEITFPNPLEVNSAILYSLQFGTSNDPKSVALLSIIYTIIRSQVFDQLRTKEQLSYVVRTSQRSGDALLSFFFVLQSLRDPFYLEQRINAFLYRFAAYLDTLTDDEFKAYIEALVTLNLPQYKSIYEESVKYVSTIMSGFYDFDFNNKFIEALKVLTKEETRSFFYKHFYPTATNRKKLSIHLKSQTLESVSVRDLSSRRLQYYFKCNGLDISLEEYNGLMETTLLLADFEKKIKDFFAQKYQDRNVSAIVSQAFEYLKELYGKLKKDAVKDYGALHFTDAVSFKNSLKLSPAPLPILQWKDY